LPFVEDRLTLNHFGRVSSYDRRWLNARTLARHVAVFYPLLTLRARTASQGCRLIDRDLILPFSAFEANPVLAEIGEIRRWNPQRFEWSS
jgi:hypothetical protein